MQQQHLKEAVQTAVDVVDAIDDDDDCISLGDLSQAFLQALVFDEDLPPKFVSYRPYKRAKLRSFKVAAGKSLWDVSGTNGLVQYPPWMDGTNRVHQE